MMGMSSKDFWNMSLHEVTLAIQGFREFHTGKKQTGMDKNRLKELMELYPD